MVAKMFCRSFCIVLWDFSSIVLINVCLSSISLLAVTLKVFVQGVLAYHGFVYHGFAHHVFCFEGFELHFTIALHHKSVKIYSLIGIRE